LHQCYIPVITRLFTYPLAYIGFIANYLALRRGFPYIAPVFPRVRHDSGLMTGHKQDQRQEKRAAALRENLKKRKNQQQERGSARPKEERKKSNDPPDAG
jgi:hypothetical protein